jgi:hypothetical protein
MVLFCFNSIFRLLIGPSARSNARKNARTPRFGQLGENFRAEANSSLLGETLFLIFQSRFFLCGIFFVRRFFLVGFGRGF